MLGPVTSLAEVEFLRPHQSWRRGRSPDRPRPQSARLGYTRVVECMGTTKPTGAAVLKPSAPVRNVGIPHNVELPLYAKRSGVYGFSTGAPAVFRSAERSRAARRPRRTPITSSHSEMTVGPMIVSTREAVVGSPVKA